MKMITFILTMMLVFSACSPTVGNGGPQQTEIIGNATAEEILARDPDADIFQLNGIVYLNAHDIEWVQEEVLEAGEAVGIIEQEYDENLPFEDGMATELPVGTKIFETQPHKGPILVVKADDDTLVKYLGLIEG